MKLAARASGMGESATLRVARLAGELRAKGVDVADFGAGEPDFASPQVAVRAAVDALESGFTKYTPAAGIPALREAIAARYAGEQGAPWKASDVLVSVGAKAGLFEMAMALFEPGDEVVMPSPYWVSFPDQVAFAGAESVFVETDFEDGFSIRAAPIVAALTDRTKAVIVNSPCNPTGGVIEASEMRALAEACAERGVWLISDETYERFVYDGRGHASAAALAAEFPETVILVSSFSKTYAMTGWRLGYLIGPPTVVKAVSTVQSHSTSNATSFAMKGALAALAGAEDEVEAMIAEYAVRRDLVARLLADMPGVQCVPPAGAFYVFPRVADHYSDALSGSVPFAEHLLETARVAVVPGAAFGADEHIRISFACSRETLESGLGRIAEALAVSV